MAWDPQQRELVRLGPFLLHLVRDGAVLSQQTLSSVRIRALGPGPWQLPRLAEWWESSRLQTCQYSDLQKLDSGGIWLTGRRLPGPGLQQQFSNLLVL